MNILFLSRWFPYPTNNGSKLRIYNLIRGLAAHHRVTLLTFADQTDVNPDVPEIRTVCSEVHMVPWREFNPNSTRARLGFLSRTPRSLIDTFSLEMAQKISRLVETGKYDLVIASQLSMASYRSYFKELPAIFDEVEIGLTHDKLRVANPKEQLRHAFTWFKLRVYLSQLLNSFQACTVASHQEYQLLCNDFSLPDVDLEVIPNGVDVSKYENHRTAPIANQIIFAGSFRYGPNYEAMQWYLEKIQPLVLEGIADASLVITGDHMGLPLPSARNVRLTGYVDDIKTLISSSCVSIAPLLTGGGTRLKILEAMASGVPVVSTRKGTEGLMVRDGEHLLIADDPEKFAGCIIRLLQDKAFGERISSSALHLVQEHYDWAAVMPKFLKLTEQVVSG
jgi:glycosyltransferase involved in cell wall biosynthesis